ncbi:MAG: endo-1,3-alpha-glucanase family glycosylhydrolase, partial [Phycisphaeraceae bacterium JB051]
TYDRNTLGKWVGTDTGAISNVHNQILSAMQYGLNGFCVDFLSTGSYTGSMGKYYKSAEGLDFHIALCVDGWHESIDKIVTDMTSFLERWGNHPNNAFIDGKPVIFMYKLKKTPAECKQILDALAARGLQAYWLLQPQRETTLWTNRELICDYLQVFDGLYDFGINGYSQADNNLRLQNGRAALTDVGRPNGLLCAGITQGYIGPSNAFYRPFFGSGSFQINWNAALNANAQWVCLTTWNDYWETTHFEPSVWGNDVLLNLNKEKMRTWQDQPFISRTPQVYVSYQQELRLGDHWELEIASLPYSSNQSSFLIKLLDMDNNLIEESDPYPLSKNEETIHRFKYTSLGLTTPRRLKIMVKVRDNLKPGDDSDGWVRLYPLTVRPGIMKSMRTIRFNLNRMYEAAATTKINDNKITATLKSWTWTGKADLYQNTQFIATKDIAKFGGNDTNVTFDLDEVIPQYPQDMYTVRFSRDDGMLLWSNPILVNNPNVDMTTTVNYPVLQRHTTFDNAWLEQVTGYNLNGDPYTLTQHTLPLAEVFTLHLPMDQRNGIDAIAEIGGWHWPTLMGATHRNGKVDQTAIPQWVDVIDYDANPRKALHFDGANDRIAFKSRSMPHDMVTVEMWIKPDHTNNAMYLFSDQNGNMNLGIDDQGRLFVKSFGQIATATQTVSTTDWTHVSGSYDGQSIRLKINFTEAATISYPHQSRGFNSLGLIGGLIAEGSNLSKPYQGLMAGFALRALPDTYGSMLPPSQ